MLSESSKLSDLIRKGQVAFDNQDYITTAQEAFRTIQIACMTVEHDSLGIQQMAMELVQDTLERISLNDKSFHDKKTSVLPLCKMSLCYIEQSENMDKIVEQKTMTNIEVHIGNMDPLWKEERKLVKDYDKLQESPYHENILEQKSDIFGKLARINERRHPDKINLLKTCLFQRASLECMKRNSQNALQELRMLYRKVLQSSGAKMVSTDVYGASQAIRQKFDAWLHTIPNAIVANEAIHITSCDQYENEHFEKYAVRIKNVASTISDNYIDILKEVSGKCVQILGDPPCKFSHFAMGAHGTGDFPAKYYLMSAIVLENNITKKENCSKLMEYFQWYAIIFQIFIYFGDESENKLTGQNKKTDKMYLQRKKSGLLRGNVSSTNTVTSHIDDVTAKLINLNINMELTNTVNDMVKLFTEYDSSRDNQDVVIALSRTRHIAGNESIHKKMKKRIRKVIYSKGYESEHFKHLVLQQFSRTKLEEYTFHKALTTFSNETESSSLDATICHFAFQFTDTLGHLAHIEKNSAFAVAQRLVSKGYIDDKAGGSLNIALAISREMLMKQCVSLLPQDCDCENDLTYANIRKQKFIKLVFVLSALQKVKNALLDLSGNIAIIKSKSMEVEDIGEKAEILCHFEMYADALEILEYASSRLQVQKNPAFQHFMEGLCLTRVQRIEDANRTLERGLTILSSLPEADQSKVFHFIQYLLGMNYLSKKEYLKAKEHLQNAKNGFKSKNEFLLFRADELYLEILDGLAESEFHLGEFNLACLECADFVSQYDSMSIQRFDLICRTMTIQSECLMKLGNFNECARILENALARISAESTSVENIDLEFDKLKTNWLLKVADCNFRLNQIEVAEQYCKKVLQFAKECKIEDSGTIANARLISAQCHLWQSRNTEACKDACEAIAKSLQTLRDESNILYIIQTAVTVISRSVSPMSLQTDIRRGLRDVETERRMVTHASEAYSALCKQSLFQGHQLQRDKSVLFRVIQTGLFRINNYEKVLDLCKTSVELVLKESADKILISRNILDIIEGDEYLRDNCVRDCEYFCEAAQYCNIRDAFSISGSVIVFCGSLYKCGLGQDKDVAISPSMNDWLSHQSEVTKFSVLHCTIKIVKYLVEHFLNKVKSSNVTGSQHHKDVPFLAFLSDIFEVLKVQRDSPKDLLQETAILTATAATCWMKAQHYERALSILNDALELQERLALDITSIVYIDSNEIIQNIGVCLAKLGRWEEADSYLNRGTAMKERRRKSRAYEDYSMIHARVKSARCSFSVGNYQEAVYMASTAFHDGLLMDSIDNHDDSMISAVGIVLKSTLAVSAHAEAESDKSLVNVNMLKDILIRASTLRETLENQSDPLGGAYAETVESFYYACGNCLLAFEQHKHAMKSFKKSLKIMKQKGIHFPGLKQPIMLNIAKCLIGQNKFKRAEKHLCQFLEMEQEKNQTTLHAHPSHAYVLLSICSQRRNLYSRAYEQAVRSVHEARSTESNMLIQQITKECADIFILLLHDKLNTLNLD